MNDIRGFPQLEYLQMIENETRKDLEEKLERCSSGHKEELESVRLQLDDEKEILEIILERTSKLEGSLQEVKEQQEQIRERIPTLLNRLQSVTEENTVWLIISFPTVTIVVRSNFGYQKSF